MGNLKMTKLRKLFSMFKWSLMQSLNIFWAQGRLMFWISKLRRYWKFGKSLNWAGPTYQRPETVMTGRPSTQSRAPAILPVTPEMAALMAESALPPTHVGRALCAGASGEALNLFAPSHASRSRACFFAAWRVVPPSPTTAIPSHRCSSRPKGPSSAPLRPATGSSLSHGPLMQGTPYTEPSSPSAWVTADHRSPCTSGSATASRRTTRAHHSSMTRSSPSMTHYPSRRHLSVRCHPTAAVSFPPSSTPNWDPRGLGLVPGYSCFSISPPAASHRLLPQILLPSSVACGLKGQLGLAAFVEEAQCNSTVYYFLFRIIIFQFKSSLNL
jgi:hypothetical protein